MPIRDLDTDQKFAATSSGDEVVVSAGAGSGKTRLLVGRYLYLLRNWQALKPHPLTPSPPPGLTGGGMAGSQGVRFSLSSIVAITFTNKAADQMKSRISRRARELAVEYPDEKAFWLDEVAARIHTAPISTIHSFCNSILRSYPVEAALDPLFTIADDTTLSELKNEAVARFLTDRLNDAPDTADMLIRTFGVRGYKRLLNMLLADRITVIKYIDEHGELSPVEIGNGYLSLIRAQLDRYHDMLTGFHTLRPGDDSLADLLGRFIPGIERIRSMVAENAVESLFIRNWIDNIQPVGNAGSPKKWGAQGVDPGDVRSGIRDFVAFVEKVLQYYTIEKDTVPQGISLLLNEFRILEQFYLQLKKNRSFLDHDDTLIETWRLLRNNVVVRQKVSRLYTHILVDEFQDTDSLQMDIIRMIADTRGATLFTVGDPKQSIYRFRGADVAVFNTFKARQNVEFKALKLNYRSAPAIVGFVNHVFGRIMGRDMPEHPFETDYRDMKSYRRPSYASGVEITVIDAPNADTGRSAEAVFIARRALELKDEHGFSFGQMALLLRKGTQSAYYEKAFLAHDIPFVNLTQGNPFENPEAYDVANLLGWLCDPDDAVLLTGALLSPFFGVTADFLVRLRALSVKESSMPRVFLSGNGPDFFSDRDCRNRDVLRKLLSIRERATIREILETAFDETDYTLTLLADPLKGEHSLTVLDHILIAADRFESQGGAICDFTRLLLDGELSSEKSLSIETGRETLRIITIHGAKGMEYPVVFLGDVSSRPVNSSKPFLISAELGPGLDILDTCRNTVKTFVKALLQEEETKKDRAESKRLFYVGCTRAQEYLVISGGKPSKTIDETFEKENWMGWLHTALSLTPEGEFTGETPPGLFTCRRIDASERETEEPSAARWKRVLEDLNTASDTDTANIDELCPPVPELPLSHLPETLSPTQITDYCACPALYRYRHIYRIEAGRTGDSGSGFGARYGLFAHRVLQGWDFSDAAGSLARVDELVDRTISSNVRERLKTALKEFARTELHRRIQGSDDIRREEPFAFIHDGVLVRGTIDLMCSLRCNAADRSGDEVIILDYKTGRPEGGDRESSDLLRSIASSDSHSLQLQLYAAAVYRALYVIPSQLLIYYLSTGEIREVTCGETVIDAMSSMLTETISSLASGDFAPKRTDSCASCPYRRLCEK